MTATLSDQAFEIVKTEILTRALEPGQQIALSDMAGRHALRTTPVREAPGRLAVEGFVKAIPHFGYVVAPIALSDIHEIFELRCVLEVAAARMAVFAAPKHRSRSSAALLNTPTPTRLEQAILNYWLRMRVFICPLLSWLAIPS